MHVCYFGLLDGISRSRRRGAKWGSLVLFIAFRLYTLYAIVGSGVGFGSWKICAIPADTGILGIRYQLPAVLDPMLRIAPSSFTFLNLSLRTHLRLPSSDL
ncbi:hypothetical protein BD310DRAFT_912738, partial [Dichomitus squalens]